MSTRYNEQQNLNFRNQKSKFMGQQSHELDKTLLPLNNANTDHVIPTETLNEFASALDELQHQTNNAIQSNNTHQSKEYLNLNGNVEENHFLKLKIFELERELNNLNDCLIKSKTSLNEVELNQTRVMHEFDKLKLLFKNTYYNEHEAGDDIFILVQEMDFLMKNGKYKTAELKSMMENYTDYYNFEDGAKTNFNYEYNQDAFENNDINSSKVPLPTATSTPVNVHLNNANLESKLNLMSPQLSHDKPISPLQFNQVRANSLDDVNLDDKKSLAFKKGALRYGKENDYQNLKDELAQKYRVIQNTEKVEVAKDPIKKKTGRSIRQFFGRIIRSNSQDLDVRNDEFKRGSGVRSTAGPRLGWTREISLDPDLPFRQWDVERIALWFHSMGLSAYLGDCKRWVKNGEHLLDATPHDIEKELCIKNNFHRKKLQLALQSMVSEPKSAISSLDHNWVTKWLDDVGLPQYKDNFIDARIDGRMLNYLTIDELISLKVTNLLHHMSIRRGIEILRSHNFNPSFLKRRPSPEEGVLQNCPSDVVSWTNHRVMEWLRSIDLSEYAPNLRGSGVHGALMILEPRLSAELFATLLSIPLSKTLLRRHLTTHFVALIGPNVQQQKREVENDPAYSPMVPGQKIKQAKKASIFKSVKNTEITEEYICPFDKDTDNFLSSYNFKNRQFAKSAMILKQSNNEKTTAYTRSDSQLPSSDV